MGIDRKDGRDGYSGYAIPGKQPVAASCVGNSLLASADVQQICSIFPKLLRRLLESRSV